MIVQLILLTISLITTFMGGYWIGTDRADAKYRIVLAHKNSALRHLVQERDKKQHQLDDIRNQLRRQRHG